jgi:hypothetical protein
MGGASTIGNNYQYTHLEDAEQDHDGVPRQTSYHNHHQHYGSALNRMLLRLAIAAVAIIAIILMAIAYGCV